MHPGAAVFKPVHAWTSDELEEDVRAAVLVLRVRRLDAELVRVRPDGTARRALVMREPGEEPVVRAVPVVDFECHEQTSAECDRGENRATAEDRYADADALHCATRDTYVRALIEGVSVVEGNVGIDFVTIKPNPAWK